MAHATKRSPTPGLAGGASASLALAAAPRGKSLKSKTQANRIVAVVRKNHPVELRILLIEWRGQRKTELRDYTTIVSSCMFPAGAGITLDIEKLPGLIEALRQGRGRQSVPYNAAEGTVMTSDDDAVCTSSRKRRQRAKYPDDRESDRDIVTGQRPLRLIAAD